MGGVWQLMLPGDMSARGAVEGKGGRGGRQVDTSDWLWLCEQMCVCVCVCVHSALTRDERITCWSLLSTADWSDATE